MILVQRHRARLVTLRDWATVTALETVVDQDKMERLRQEYLKNREFTKSSSRAVRRYQPGDDLLFILVAGDVREHQAGARRTARLVKAEAVTKKEIPA